MCKLICFFILAIAVSGCAGGDILVKIPPSEFQNQNRVAEVKVNDSRDPGLAISSREAAFGEPMGNISFDPPEPVLVKNFMESELNKILSEKAVQTHQDYDCDIVEFGVNTKTTLTYWDVVGRIRLILKHDGKVYNISGTSTIRTFIWPGQGVITQVVNDSLKQVAENMRKAL